MVLLSPTTRGPEVKSRVAVAGVGQTKFGVHKGQALSELAAEASFSAMADAGVDRSDIGFVSVGVASGSLSGQLSPAASILDAVGLVGVPCQRSEAACATGSAAIYAAYSHISSGLADTAIVIGAEIMTQGGTSSATDYLAQMTDCRWEYSLGITFPGMFALMASAHMKEFGTTEEDLALVSCKNHRNALKNEDAQFHKTVSVEDVLGSPPVAPPLKLLDCSPLSDGAAAIILASEEKARTYTDTPVWVRAIGAASSGNLLSQRKHLSSIPSIRLAAMRAFQQSGLSSKDMDFAEVHDCFTIAEIIAYEELGFAERGKGAKLLRDGATEIGGDIPVNASGGLKAKGHPLGATGVGMVVELTRQLRSEVEKSRQIKDAKVGLAQNMGLTGQYSYVSIYSR